MNKTIWFITALIKRIKEDEVPAMASQLAYSMILSFMPFLIFLLAIVGFTPLRSKDLLVYMEGIIPRESLSLIKDIIAEVTDVKKGDLLSFSLIATLWSATGGIKAVVRCLNKAYDEKEKRGFLRLQLLYILFTLGLVLVVILTMGLLVFGNVIGNYLSCCFEFSDVFVLLWNIFRYVIIVLVMAMIFTFIYHYTPSRRLIRKEVIPGALFSTAGWIIISMGFSFYVDNFANYSRVYGGIAAIFILMVWIYLSSLILLIGGEINATLALDLEQ
ncbi:YihY/virulence factor BrkB family protein [Clostridium thermarum]|uniref:YihY/virulence factor BrkB family protein n=1 Tax=Clostridium thermarum TaxID=1716543 RepID=UPI001FAAD6F1|nr:YihY/virulence factor BrkB family protein [Clostridium thermarum]